MILADDRPRKRRIHFRLIARIHTDKRAGTSAAETELDASCAGRTNLIEQLCCDHVPLLCSHIGANHGSQLAFDLVREKREDLIQLIPSGSSHGHTIAEDGSVQTDQPKKFCSSNPAMRPACAWMPRSGTP